MSQFIPGQAHGSLQPYIYQPDPRYQIRAEWRICRDGIRRPQYRAFFEGCTIGEIAPCFQRVTVIADLQELIDAGGIAHTADLPATEVSDDAE